MGRGFGSGLIISHSPPCVKYILPFAFSFLGKFLLLFFVFGHAAICCLQAMASALIAMAQMKPSNSRATAVMTFL